MKPLHKLTITIILTLPLWLASLAAAQQSQEALYEGADGRLRGYEGTGIVLEETHIAVTYLALIALSTIAVGVLFKSARRSHLD